MATVKQTIWPGYATPASTNGAQFKSNAGTNFPVDVWAFDGATEESIYLKVKLVNYGSGNLTMNVDWYADSGTSGDVIWGAQIACITPNTDTQDIETKSFATASTVTDTHLGTTAQRLHTTAITISNLDSAAADDAVYIRFYRDADAAGDTINAIDCFLAGLDLTYSDT